MKLCVDKGGACENLFSDILFLMKYGSELSLWSLWSLRNVREKILYTEIVIPTCLSYAQASESFSVAGCNGCNYLLERCNINNHLYQSKESHARLYKAVPAMCIFLFLWWF